jgi:hypothetical protein
VSFRQPVTSMPHVDAAWWPRSRDLKAELPGLLDVLWTACRDVSRVSYSSDSWLPVARRLRIGGRPVRLGGFTHQDASLMTLRDVSGTERIDVLVIPPDTDPTIAAHAMRLASREGRNERAATMLEMAGSQPDERPSGPD